MCLQLWRLRRNDDVSHNRGTRDNEKIIKSNQPVKVYFSISCFPLQESEWWMCKRHDHPKEKSEFYNVASRAEYNK